MRGRYVVQFLNCFGQWVDNEYMEFFTSLEEAKECIKSQKVKFPETLYRIVIRLDDVVCWEETDDEAN